MTPCQVHLDHALPLLPELGLEYLVPLLAEGGQVALDTESIEKLVRGLATGAKSRALRKFVAVSRGSAEEVFAWEVDSAREALALKEAALLPWQDSVQAVLDFFSSFGISLSITQDSSDPAEPKKDPETPPPGTPETPTES